MYIKNSTQTEAAIEYASEKDIFKASHTYNNRNDSRDVYRNQ